LSETDEVSKIAILSWKFDSGEQTAYLMEKILLRGMQKLT